MKKLLFWIMMFELWFVFCVVLGLKLVVMVVMCMLSLIWVGLVFLCVFVGVFEFCMSWLSVFWNMVLDVLNLVVLMFVMLLLMMFIMVWLVCRLLMLEYRECSMVFFL